MEGHYASAHKNSAEISANVYEISSWFFSVFQMAIGHHVEFLKGQNFIWRGGPEDRDTSSVPNFVEIGPSIASILQFLARDVIYTSRNYATMSVSVCLSVCPCALTKPLAVNALLMRLRSWWCGYYRWSTVWVQVCQTFTPSINQRLALIPSAPFLNVVQVYTQPTYSTG